MSDLIGHVAIITGAAKGIGEATARLFAQAGAITCLWDVLEKGQEVADSIVKEGYTARFNRIDTTDSIAVKEKAEALFEEFGHLDILINNAGITRDSTLLKMTRKQWDQVLDVNLSGVFNCTQAIAPYMVQRKYGRIINAASIVGLYGNFGQSNYVASKSAIIGLTKVWARELGKHGITSNAVAPGFIETDMTDAIPEEIKNNVIQTVPAKRLGKPEDIAHAYLYLASREASFVNGACLSVDGGAVI